MRPSRESELRGIGLVAASAVCFAVMSMLIKALKGSIGTAEICLFRNALALPVVLRIMRRQGLSAASRRWPLLVSRGLWGIGSMACYFWALAHIPLGTAVLLNYTAPLFAAVIAVVALGESLTPASGGLLASALTGVALVVHPQGGSDWVGYAIGLGAGVIGGVSYATVRALTKDEPAWRIVFYFNLVGAAATAPFAVVQWSRPDVIGWAVLLAVSTSATAGQGLMTRGFELCPVSKSGAAMMLSVVMTAAGGWMFWNERPNAATWVGMALVVGSVVGLGWMKSEPLALPLSLGERAR